MTLPWMEPKFTWDPCLAGRTGLHAWVPDDGRFVDSKHYAVHCSVCRASGTFTKLELQRWAALYDERLAAQRRRPGGRQ